MEKSESIKEIANALCKFQAEVEKIKKGAVNPFFKSKYATLADILDVIRQPLADNGLSFVQFPKEEHGLETMLMHISGEFLSESYSMRPVKDDPQGAGSVITYQRRYALGAVLGLNIDSDDDGNKASGIVDKPKEFKKEVLTPEHPNWGKVITFLKGNGTMTEVMKKYIIDTKNEKLLINATFDE
jgi:hypothetical protein